MVEFLDVPQEEIIYSLRLSDTSYVLVRKGYREGKQYADMRVWRLHNKTNTYLPYKNGIRLMPSVFLTVIRALAEKYAK